MFLTINDLLFLFTIVYLINLLFEGYIQPPPKLTEEALEWIESGYTAYIVGQLQNKLSVEAATLENFKEYNEFEQGKQATKRVEKAIMAAKVSMDTPVIIEGPLVPFLSRHGEVFWRVYKYEIIKSEDEYYDVYSIYNNDRQAIAGYENLEGVQYFLTNRIREQVFAAEDMEYTLKSKISAIKNIIENISDNIKTSDVFAKGFNSKQFFINLKNWKYAEQKDLNFNITQNFITIAAILNDQGVRIGKPGESRAYGIFRGISASPSIEIYMLDISNFEVRRMMELYKSNISIIKQTVVHELIHLSQVLIHKNKGGYPSRQLKNNNPELESIAALKDIEFYTAFSDNLDDLEQILNRIKNSDDKLIQFGSWVGLQEEPKNEFFKTLKKYNEGKWKKAVKEMWKALKDKNKL